MMKDFYRRMKTAIVILSLALGTAGAFTTSTSNEPHHVAWSSLSRQQQPTTTTATAAAVTTTRLNVSSSSRHSGKHQQQQHDSPFDFLMDDFKTSNGELLNPYKVLKVPREADRVEIKQAYRSLCRRYHPDGVRHRPILPGSCDNLQQVADHWERIKLSYEILMDPKRRKRFDRAEVLSDPGQALGRAMGRAALDGATSLGKGIFGLGATVVQHVVTGTKTTTTTTKTSVLQQQQQQQSTHLESNSSDNSYSKLLHFSKDQISENV